MKKPRRTNLLLGILSRPLTWAVVALVSLLLYLSAWPVFQQGMVLPRAVPSLRGLQVNVYDRPQIKGCPSKTLFFSGERLSLSRSNTSLMAYGVWQVPESGRYRLNLECDDFGTLQVNGRELIRLQGMNARNQGEAEVELKKGRYLLVLSLFNGPGQGWITLSSTLEDRPISILGGRDLLPIDWASFPAWMKVIEGIQKGTGLSFLFSAALFFLWVLVKAGTVPATETDDGEALGQLGQGTQGPVFLRTRAHAYIPLFFLGFLLILGLTSSVRTAFLLWQALPSFPLQNGNNPLSAFERQVGKIRPYLPSRGTVGFFSDPENPLDLFRLQYALSPLIVTSSKDQDLLIGLIHDPAAFDSRFLEKDYRLVRDFHHGWVLWKRKGP